MFFTRFSELCEAKNKKPTTVGIELGIPRGTISYWKHSNAVPKQDVLVKIAEYFCVSVDYLLGQEKKTAQTDGLSDKTIAAIKMYESLSAEQQAVVDALLATMTNNK